MGYAFISYSSKNQSSADAMRELFKKNNIDTWMAPYDIPAGSEYAEVLYDALVGCSCLVLMLTDNAQNSQWVKKEVNIAITNGKTIIPVKLEDIELNSSMKLYLNDQQITVVHKIDENAYEIKKVLDAVKAYTEEHKKKTEDISAESLNVYAAQTDKENTSKNFPYTIVTPNFRKAFLTESFLNYLIENKQESSSVKGTKAPALPSVKLGYSDCIDLENKSGGYTRNRLIIPDKYTEISGNAFDGIHCEKIYIPHSITYINDTSLVNLGYNVKTIYIHEMNKNYMIIKENGRNALFDLNRNINIPIKSGVSLEYYYK